MKALLLLSAVVAVLPASALCEGAAGKEYLLMHKSEFGAPDDGRNPFWPIGFKPSAAAPDTPQAPVQEAQVEVHPENYVVTTISMERDAPLAVINGRTHGVGDNLPVPGSASETITVRKIVDGAVILDFHGQLYRIPSGRRSVGK